MPGNKIGGLRAAYTNKSRHGEDYYAVIGALGGSRKVPKGFALDRELARSAGAKGGSISRRTQRIPDVDFMLIWNEADSMDEVMDIVHNTSPKLIEKSVLNRVSLLRQAGYEMKSFKRKHNYAQLRQL